MTKRRVSDAEIDRAMAPHDTIVPASGFVSAVMARVHEEASATRPLAFPWLRALPGLAAIACAFVWALVTLPPASAPVRLAPEWLASENPLGLAAVVTVASLALAWALLRAAPMLGARRDRKPGFLVNIGETRFL
jgi:hypothetical protein